MVPLEPVVQVLGRPVLGLGQDGAQRRRVALGLVARDAGGRHTGRGDGALEEGPRGRRVAVIAQVDVDDLAVLVDGAEDVPPAPADLEQRLVHPPPGARSGAVRAGGLDEAGREGLDPIVDRARVDRDAPLGQQLGDLDVAQAIAEVPAHREGDDVVREPVAAEGRAGPRGHPSAAPGAAIELAADPVPPGLGEPLARAPIAPHARLRPRSSGHSVAHLTTSRTNSLSRETGDAPASCTSLPQPAWSTGLPGRLACASGRAVGGGALNEGSVAR